MPRPRADAGIRAFREPLAGPSRAPGRIGQPDTTETSATSYLPVCRSVGRWRAHDFQFIYEIVKRNREFSVFVGTWTSRGL